LSFELDGEKFTALNGGPEHSFNEFVSFVVRCESQDEIDYYYSKPLAGGGGEIARGCSKIGSGYAGRWCRHASANSSGIPKPSFENN